MKGVNTILIAESESINAAYLRTLLERSGWKAEIAHNTQDAAEKIRHQEYAVVFLDEKLNNDGTINLTDEIRQCNRDRNIHTAIVGMTAVSLEAGRQRCIKAGMDFCLSKPVYKNQLMETLTCAVSSTGSIA